MKRKLIGSLLCLCALGLASCNQNTFSGDWSSNALMHWHASTSGDNSLAKDLSMHNFGNDNVCDDCGYVRAKVNYNFNFVSDICDLNNEKTYEEGTLVNLTLTARSGYYLPETINVYINGVEASSGAYTYNNSTGTITLTVNGDVLIRAMGADVIEKYQITSKQLDAAKDFASMDYVQAENIYGFYSDYNLYYINSSWEYGKNVAHRSLFNLFVSENISASSSYSDCYIKKDGEDYRLYYYSRYDGWASCETNASEFSNYKEITINRFYKINEFEITFDKLNGHFNNLTCCYEIEFTANNINWEMQISFLEGKLTSINYSGVDTYYTYMGYYSFSYNQVEPSIPSEAINSDQPE